MDHAGAPTSLERARDRLGLLGAEIEAWARGQQAPLRHEHDVAAGVHEWRIEAPGTVPDAITAGAADVLTALRSALDEAAQAGAAAAGAAPDQLAGIRFPVTSSITEFEQAAEESLADAPDQLRAAIESFQLYQLPPNPIVSNLGVLARLAALAARDELSGHIVIAAGVDPRAIEVIAEREGASANVTAGYSIGKPADGELALRIELTPADTPIQVTPFNPPSLVIAFGDEQARVAVPDMQNLIATVARVHAELVPATPPAG